MTRVKLHHKYRRTGFTLSELMVSMVIGSSLMVLAIGVLQKSFRWSTDSRHRAADEQSFDRLQRQFRSDVHLATEADVTDTAVTLQIDESTVTYKFTGDTFTRIQQSMENATQQDQFRLRGINRAKFGQLTKPDRVTLTTYKQTPIKDPTGVPIWRNIEAVIDFSQRHLKEQE